MKMYYCPRGCNIADERAMEVTGFECGACGCVMTTDSTWYDKVHERIEEEGIAEAGRQIQQEAMRKISARFQRNRDGQYVGYLVNDDVEVDCWLVSEHPAIPEAGATFLRLSFTNPYPGPAVTSAYSIKKSAKRYFIGLEYPDGVDRISFQYWRTHEAAQRALTEGRWTPGNVTSSDWEWGD